MFHVEQFSDRAGSTVQIRTGLRGPMKLLQILCGHFLRIALRQNSFKLWFLLSVVLILTSNRITYFDFGDGSLSREFFLSEFWMAGGVLTIAFFHLISREVLRGGAFHISSRPVSAATFYFSELLAAVALNCILGGFLLLVFWIDSKVMAKPRDGGLITTIAIGIVSLVSFSSYCSLVVSLSLSSNFWCIVLMIGGGLLGQIGNSFVAKDGFSAIFEMLYCFIPDTTSSHDAFAGPRAAVDFGVPLFLQIFYFSSFISFISIITVKSYGRDGFVVRD